MSADAMSERIREASPRSKARMVGVFYLLAILTGVSASFLGHGRPGFAAGVMAGSCNIAVTLLLYDIFMPVNGSLSLLAAFFGLVVSSMGALEWHPQGAGVGRLSFGAYCLLIGYLIFRSSFLPRTLGALMAFAGLSWLIFLSPPLASRSSLYPLAAGIVGQGSLALWLLVMGVNAERWREQAGTLKNGEPSAPCTSDSSPPIRRGTLRPLNCK
ncbi:MAG TPA: DUF4386 domain-containing protein [Candidatus Acidoferrales bacterium]|nr:DUF4386 domain-containing protein [Candidatus Acidoferrales bacterium]